MGSTAVLSARDRILSLLDENSFVEIGALVTKRSTDFNLNEKEVPGDGVIAGYGLIDGSLVYVYSQNKDALGGTMGEMHARQIVNVYDLATKVGVPVVAITDCAGMRLEESTDALDAFGKVYARQVLASGVIPTVTVILGTCGGGSAISAAISDFVIMTKENAKLFVNSPNAVDNNYTAKCNTAGAAFQAESGNVDIVAEDDAEALAKARELVSILPSNNEDTGVLSECEDDLNRATVNLGSHVKDASVALREISDNNWFLELKADCAKEMVIGFIRLNGAVVGVVANRSELLGEDGKVAKKFDTVLTMAGAYKAAHFVEFCDSFSIPVLTLTSVTGFASSVGEERSIARALSQLTAAFANATVPKVNLIVGKAYGSAYITMNSKHIGADLVFAYNDAEIGMMDAKLAAEIIYDGKDAATISEKANEYAALQNSPVAAAKRGFVDSIIEPAATRKQLIYAFEMLYTKREHRPNKKHSTI